jgi:hypothetical protein
MPQPQSSGARWFPTTEQLKDPAATERAFRQVLTQFYALQDRVNAMTIGAVGAASGKPAAEPAPGNGPADSILVGLNIAPVDTTTLANGATLQYDKAAGNLKFA